MSIRSLSQGFKNIIKPRRQNSLELLLFPAKMKNRDLLRKSPQADFFLEISYQIAEKSQPPIPALAESDLNWVRQWLAQQTNREFNKFS